MPDAPAAGVPAGLIDSLKSLLGDKHVLTDPGALAPYLDEERGLYRGAAPVVARPGSTEEVAAVVKACAEAGVPMVPIGGNTGLMGGAVSGEAEVLVSLGRLNRIREIDPQTYTMTVEAGVILEDIQNAAIEKDCFFPLALGAQGTCQIGGNLATNAGGINVLRYGNTRELVLGIEAVLPDGRVWKGLKKLRKDNTGYDLRDLMIGSEGTLGFITAAVLKLFPRPTEKQTALCAIDELDNVLELLSRARRASGDMVTAFELIPRLGLEFLATHVEGCEDPFAEPHPWYALIEFSSSSPVVPLRETFETLLENTFEDGIVVDAIIAESIDQEKQLWRMRESLPEAQKHEGGSIKHDVSVPVDRVPDFLRRATDAVETEMPGIRVCAFGHVGDGNIHFNLSQPTGMDKAEYLAQWDRMNRVVHDIVADMAGSISAEHGVGKLKVEELKRYKQPLELEMMQAIKRALDPRNLMNPGKVVERGE